jgi:hypothetical protein
MDVQDQIDAFAAMDDEDDRDVWREVIIEKANVLQWEAGLKHDIAHALIKLLKAWRAPEDLTVDAEFWFTPRKHERYLFGSVILGPGARRLNGGGDDTK